MGNTSYGGMLKKYCEKIKPKRILEWGPGESTEMMLNWCPETVIYTVEHQEKWYKFWSLRLKTPIDRLHMFLVNAPEDDREHPFWDTYTRLGVKGKFDLIFIDGRERVRCMEYAKEVLSPNGVVILHDAQRGEYQEGIKMFKIIEEDGQTKVMK